VVSPSIRTRASTTSVASPPNPVVPSPDIQREGGHWEGPAPCRQRESSRPAMRGYSPWIGRDEATPQTLFVTPTSHRSA
jgi:hypothetical protein